MILIAIGGAEDKTGDMTVLKRVLAEAKGAQSRVHVITTATSLPEEVKAIYEEAFGLLGVKPVVSHITTRDEADDPATIAQIEDADVIFFSGGDQRKIAAAFRGSKALKKIRQMAHQGTVIAGTSAGAAAISDLMIAGGGSSDHITEVKLNGGLGLKRKIVFDTHFSKRRRLARLFDIVAAHPDKIGIGLDDNTAVVMKSGRALEVIGEGTVTVLDNSFQPKKLVAGQHCNLRTGRVF
jgi:cyanophycinase